MSDPKKRELDERSIENYLYASDKLRMYALVTEMMNAATTTLKNSITALEKVDLDAAEKIIAADNVINELEEQIDEECLYSIAMRQPLREDLRYVYAVMKIITDIERIGDQAVNLQICLKSYAEKYHGRGPLPKIEEIKKIGLQCSEMAEDFLTALQNEDAEVLARVHRSHAETVSICDRSLDDLMCRLDSAQPDETPAGIFQTVDMFRHLKRVADHLMNLAEKVYFIATGISPLTLKKGMRQNDADFSS